MKLGIVFEGGGGKGAYQIGSWKAIRELGLEKYVTCVSGTSVGALNAALFYQGNYLIAEETWNNISEDDILHIKSDDDFNNGDCFFSQKQLSNLIDTALRGQKVNRVCRECYITCRYRDKNEYRYFKWSDYFDFELKKKILLASSALPIIFESVEIDNERYVDGGANGDNTPIRPLENKGLDYIIVIHLSEDSVSKKTSSDRIIDVYPSASLGGFLDGVLGFDTDSIHWRMELGYSDTKKALYDISERCSIPTYSPVKSRSKKSTVKPINKKINDSLEVLEMVDFKFTDDEARKEYEQKLESLKKVVDNIPVNNAFLWDATVERYATKMTKVNTILRSEGINEQITTKMFKDIDTFLKRCSDAEFHIALVGAIKAGKSTLINALLGYEYASTKVTPETASLTKFKKGNDYVKVSFYTASEWDELWKSANEAKATVFLEEYAKLGAESEKTKWLNQAVQTINCASQEELVSEIQKWTSSKSVCHYFVKEVEVGLKNFDLPEGVVLVDTPGLDDVVEYRSNITRDYIDRANAVLVCVKADALTGQEMATIYSVFANTRYNPEKVYIIATQVDTLNRPIESWREQQEEWLKYLKGQSAFASLELAKKNLVPVSAYLYTLLKQYNDLTEDDDKYWDLDSIIRKFRIKDINEKYQEMLDFTNISLLKTKMQKEIVTNYKKLLVDDITGSYDLCKESIKSTLARIKEAQEDIIKTSQGGIDEIKKKQAECETKYLQAEADKKELDALLNRLKTATTKRADELEKAIKDLAN